MKQEKLNLQRNKVNNTRNTNCLVQRKIIVKVIVINIRKSKPFRKKAAIKKKSTPYNDIFLKHTEIIDVNV